MERCTERLNDHQIRIKGCSTIYGSTKRKGAHLQNAIITLAAYEDTNQMPEDILSDTEMAEIACAMELLKKYQALGTPERLKVLLERDARHV